MMMRVNQEAARKLDRGRMAIRELAKGGEINAADVATLRCEFFRDGFITREEADALFALERAAPVKCLEWTQFFVETITHYVVWQERPTGVVNEAQGEWLLASADAVASVNGLAALVNVLAESHRAPLWFLAAVRARAGLGWTGVEESRALAA